MYVISNETEPRIVTVFDVVKLEMKALLMQEELNVNCVIAEARLCSCLRDVPRTALKHTTIDKILFDILFLSSESAALHKVHSGAFLFA